MKDSCFGGCSGRAPLRIYCLRSAGFYHRWCREPSMIKKPFFSMPNVNRICLTVREHFAVGLKSTISSRLSRCIFRVTVTGSAHSITAGSIRFAPESIEPQYIQLWMKSCARALKKSRKTSDMRGYLKIRCVQAADDPGRVIFWINRPWAVKSWQ